MASSRGGEISAAQFRRALGHYPTGVAVIAARDDAGEQLAMVVGTFTSVSLDPPLVGFLPDQGSTTWPRIRAAGHFSVSVLGADQEQVCRAFATKALNRFEEHCPPRSATSSGDPRVAGAVLWIDCDVESVLPAGDHAVVLGRVRELTVPEEAGMPLLFLRGGYGSPVLPSLMVEAPGLGTQLRTADAIRGEVEQISHDLGVECLVMAPVDGAVVTLASAGISRPDGGSPTQIGTTFPLAAPFGALFAAWAPEPEQRAWLSRGRRLVGEGDESLFDGLLAAVREQGYEASTGRQVVDRFDRAMAAGEDPELVPDVLRTLGEELRRRPAQPCPVAEVDGLTSLAVPVRDGSGRVVVALRLIGLTGEESAEQRRACLDRLLVGATRAGEWVDRT